MKDAAGGFEHLIKLLYRPTVHNNGDVGLEFSTDAVLVDLASVDSTLVDAATVAADCDFLKNVVLAHERELRQILVELQKGTADGAAEAERIVRRIGATEADAVAAGGGLLGLVIAAIAIAATGCVGGGARHKATSPAASTTPKSPGK